MNSNSTEYTPPPPTKEPTQTKPQPVLEGIDEKTKLEILSTFCRQIDLKAEKASLHCKLDIEGVEVLFPFQPYPVQEDYMRTVIKSLQNKQNSLLQSPTGTGKTLSLLCATLAWLKHTRQQNLSDMSKNPSAQLKFNRILFCSRTHAQLKQIMKELKFTAYNPKVVILASREQYCMKKEFSNLKDLELNGACKNAIKTHACQFYNYEPSVSNRQLPRILDEVLDIEDLQNLGAKSSCKFCPYYYSREAKDEADLVILPYSFLLQQNRFQDEFQVILKDSIIIFDEAHNLPSAAEEGTSYKVDEQLIKESQKELDYLYANLTTSMKSTRDDIKDAGQLVSAFGELITQLQRDLPSDEKLKDGTLGRVAEVAELFEKIESLGSRLNLEKHDQSYNNNKPKRVYGMFNKGNSKYQQYYKDGKFDYQEMLSNLKKTQSSQQEKQMNNNNTKSNGQKTLFSYNFKKANSVSEKETQSTITGNTTGIVNSSGNQTQVKSPEQPLQSETTSRNESGKVSMERISLICNKLSKIIADMQTMKCQNIDFFAGFILGICNMYEQDRLYKNGQLTSKLSDFYKFFFKGRDQSKYRQTNGSDLFHQDNASGISNATYSAIHLWCLDPSLAFKNIQAQSPHSLLLTSGTLNPMDSWEMELQIPFKQQITTSHVIDVHESVIAAVVDKGPNNMPLNFSYNSRQSGTNSYEELGEFLIELSENVPNGILVCFSSGSLMKQAQDTWIQSSKFILQRLAEKKELFFEPKNNMELQHTMKHYIRGSQDDSKGAILFCVCRGKISEGIDFTDKLARSVVVVGIPFPPAVDTWVCTKMEYLENKLKGLSIEQKKKQLSGKEWYMLNTVRAVNQAVGRAIRHKDDYGSVFLCDNRFKQKQFSDQFSSWLKPSLGKTYWSYEQLITGIKQFFQKKREEQYDIGYMKMQQQLALEQQQSKETTISSQQFSSCVLSDSPIEKKLLKGDSNQEEEIVQSEIKQGEGEGEQNMNEQGQGTEKKKEQEDQEKETWKQQEPIKKRFSEVYLLKSKTSFKKQQDTEIQEYLLE